jgi:hypothetical protein
MVDAARDIKAGKTSYRTASLKHDVKKSTLKDFVSGGMQTKKVGRKCLLTPVEEKEIANVIDAVADWGFPIGSIDARMMAKDLVEKTNRKVNTKSGTPGNDWYEGFVKRNKISECAASNMKKSRAQVNSTMINDYFDEVGKLFTDLGNVPAENIYNYDETNFVNDPGKSIVLCRRGKKRIEIVRDHTKQCFSVMWCGNAAGELLPPMVVYSSKNVYEGWTTDGPDNAVYDCTESGWFDATSFKNWFVDVFLPSTKTKRGPILIFGDNLSSHFSWELVQLARRHHIYFVMLLPNATHLLQVLDVSVFGPMKRSWRVVLLDWRMKTRRHGNIPKQIFPRLLRLLDERVRLTVAQCLVSGFRTCGLFPLDRSQVLKKLPDYQGSLTQSQSISVLNESVTEMLRQFRESKEEEKTSKRGKKLPKKIPNLKTVIPGRALEIADEKESEEQVVPCIIDPFACLSEEVSLSESHGAPVDERPSEDEPDIRLPGKPTNRSLRTLGLTKPRKRLLKSRPPKQVCWSCSACDKNAAFKISRWITCDVCGDKYHLHCSGVDYEKENYWTLDVDVLIFNCQNCVELSAGVARRVALFCEDEEEEEIIVD